MPTLSIIHPNGTRTDATMDIGTAPPPLPVLQSYVGGLIQPVYFNDDPMGYWHIGYVNEEGIPKRLPLNPKANEIFQQYDGGLVGVCVILEGFEQAWWHELDTWTPIRAATQEECLKASITGKDLIEVDGHQHLLAEIEPEP